MSSSLSHLREDIHFDAHLAGEAFHFNSTWGLFSPREIDEGTQLLLKHVKVNATDCCLDLGCGYGPIGITLARLAPQGQTLLVDKDFIAIEYSNKNIEQNHIHNAEAMLSNGFDHIDPARRFDLVPPISPPRSARNC
jgi:16S rRNA (guanine1207-N2)-methyltransferase